MALSDSFNFTQKFYFHIVTIKATITTKISGFFRVYRYYSSITSFKQTVIYSIFLSLIVAKKKKYMILKELQKIRKTLSDSFATEITPFATEMRPFATKIEEFLIIPVHICSNYCFLNISFFIQPIETIPIFIFSAGSAHSFIAV